MLLLYILAVMSPLFILLGLLWWTVTEDSKGHRWWYRNPACRICENCDREEHQMCNSWVYERDGIRALGWWEEMKPGDGERCRSQRKGKEDD